MKTALITGISGQDGSYLAELLIEKGYDRVLGLVRRSAKRDFGNMRKLVHHPRVTLIPGELEDSGLLSRLFSSNQINECYNLAAQSFVAYSFNNPITTFMINTVGCVNLLEAIRTYSPDTRFYQASTSEMYGGLHDEPMTEQHHFHPRSPYGVSKLAAYWFTVNMREAFGVYGANGILFNHESPRRGVEFVTQKIIRGTTQYKKWLDSGGSGTAPVLGLGNLDAKRDWGDARDFVRGMWMILQQDRADDYVLATGQARSVREFVEIAFAHPLVNRPIEWSGSGTDEVGRDQDGNTVIVIDPQYYRPSEVHVLLGDCTKAREALGWQPEISFETMVSDMLEAGLAHQNS